MADGAERAEGAERAARAEPESAARRLAHRLFGGAAAAPVEPGESYAGTGLAALVALESGAGARRVTGAALAARPELAGAERGGLATALGLALGGERVAVFLTDCELAVAAPQVAEAVRRRAPLVVHVVGAVEAAREAVAADAVVLVPATAAEAVDLAFVARRFVEETLALAVLVLDGPGLALAVQEAWLPSAATLARRLGTPADEVHATGAAQRTLFGRHRRRVPRWHDSGRALRLGGTPGPLAAAPAHAAAERFFAAGAGERFEALAAEQAAATGRALPALHGRRLSRADLGVVACGPLAETATSLAEPLRAAGVRVAVFGVHRLEPFPAADLAELAGSCTRLAVVERLAAPSGHGALADAVARALAVSDRRPEIVHLAVPGAEAPLRSADLAAAFRAFASGGHRRLVLGLARGAGDDEYPKRRALHDALLRDVPELDAVAVRGSAAETIDPRPKGSVTVALHGAQPGDNLTADAARLLHALAGGHLRSAALPIAAAGAPAVERMTWAPAPVAAPADDVPVEVIVAPGDALAAAPAPAAGGALLVTVPAPGAVPSLPAGLARGAAAGEYEVIAVPAGEGGALAERERLLGALVAVVLRRAGVEIKERKLRAARERALLAVRVEERTVRLDALAAGFAGAVPVSATAASPRAAATGRPLAAQAALALGRADAALGDAARFRDQAGVLVAEGRGERILADPTLAALAVPALSSPLGAAAARQPELDPALCTGCGDCWSSCPHGAFEVRVAGAAALLASAVDRAGRPGEPLRRFAGKLAGRLTARVVERGGGDAGELFGAAAAATLADAKLEGERLAEAQAAAAAVGDLLSGAPLAATDVFLAGPEAASRGAGELLALAIDPDRCTGCDLCVAVCAPRALASAAATPDRLAAGRRAAAAVAALPAASAATVERARGDARVGALAGALLDPAAARTLGGFDGAVPGSGPRLAVRQALALLAWHLAPRRAAAAAGVAETATRLAGAIHEALATAVPDRDLAALARGLDALELPAAALADVATRLTGAVHDARVDVPRLRRLVESARALADLGERLRGGESRGARAPLGVVVGPGAALVWARRFPDNPFGVPATVAVEAPLALARGLALAEADRALAEARVLRRARLELERPAEAALAGEELAALAWSDLEPEERALATPVVALVDESAGDPELGEALAIADGDLPLAILAVANVPGAAGARASSWAALARALTAGIVAHATIAESAPLEAAAAAFAETRAGALIRVLAPRAPGAAGAAEEILIRARGVVEAREFPLGCRVAAVHPATTAPRVDPLAELAAAERRHAEELAAAEARHRAELDGAEAGARARLAATARARLLELAARRRGAEGRGAS